MKKLVLAVLLVVIFGGCAMKRIDDIPPEDQELYHNFGPSRSLKIVVLPSVEVAALPSGFSFALEML